jgi:large subunit ribosomal protein L16
LIKHYSGNIQFGLYGIKAIESGILLTQEIEAIRRVISRMTKRTGKLLIRIFFCQPITKKPLKSRMGKGVGVIKFWIAFVKKGMILLEISYISKNLASLVFKTVNLRFSLKVNLVAREIYQLND